MVSYKDMEGVTHTVEVSASSLYEAAILAMKAFEQSGWADHPVGCMEITVRSPVVRHRVPIRPGDQLAQKCRKLSGGCSEVEAETDSWLERLGLLIANPAATMSARFAATRGPVTCGVLARLQFEGRRGLAALPTLGVTARLSRRCPRRRSRRVSVAKAPRCR